MACTTRMTVRRLGVLAAGAVMVIALTAATAVASLPTAEAPTRLDASPGSGARPGPGSPSPATGKPAACRAEPPVGIGPAGGFTRDAEGRFAAIQPPGACVTKAYGVNNRGQVVGSYRTGGYQIGQGTVRHFLWRRGRLATFGLPGVDGAGVEATVTDVDDRGRLLGNTVEVASGAGHGFLRDTRGRVTWIDHPDAAGTVLGGSGTVAAQLTNRGEVVGYYAAGGTVHGFLRDRRGRFTTVDRPGAKATAVTGVNERGQLVGASSTVGPAELFAASEAFVLDRGVYASVAVPGAAATSANAIDDHGRIAGAYLDAGGAIHGFVREGTGRFTTVDHPDATVTTVVQGLNDLGQLAGLYDRPVPPAPGSQQRALGADKAAPSLLPNLAFRG
jgi:hypothetical protein